MEEIHAFTRARRGLFFGEAGKRAMTERTHLFCLRRRAQAELPFV
jgi:hypothetical protein